jgi:hypothetical protein
MKPKLAESGKEITVRAGKGKGIGFIESCRAMESLTGIKSLTGFPV